MITVQFEIGEQQAAALAEFVKRLGFSDLRAQAVDTDEAYLMRDGIFALQRGLADAGHAPR